MNLPDKGSFEVYAKESAGTVALPWLDDDKTQAFSEVTFRASCIGVHARFFLNQPEALHTLFEESDESLR